MFSSLLMLALALAFAVFLPTRSVGSRRSVNMSKFCS